MTPGDVTPPEGFDPNALTPLDGNPTQPPEAKPDPMDVVRKAAEKVAEDGKIDAQEVIDAGVLACKELGLSEAGSGEPPPLAHHALTELRKLLVPILTTLVGLVAGGAGGWWQGMVAKDEAVQGVREEVRAEEDERDAIRREVQRMIRERISERVSASGWDDVTKTVLNPSASPIVDEVLKRYSGKLDEDQVRRVAAQQIEAAQLALPREPIARPRAVAPASDQGGQ